MAEITTNQIGFYKDGNWYSMSNDTYTAFNAALLFVYTGMESSELKKVFYDDFETTVNAVKNGKMLLWVNYPPPDTSGVVAVTYTNYTEQTNELTIGFLLPEYLGMEDVIMYEMIKIKNTNGTLSAKLMRYELTTTPQD